jgi:hypothetical protein
MQENAVPTKAELIKYKVMYETQLYVTIPHLLCRIWKIQEG